MLASASRIGSSPLLVDWSQLTLGGTLAHQRLIAPEYANESWQKMKERFANREVAFYDSPRENELSQLEESVALAKSLLARQQFSDVLFLGIGGSSLGPKALLAALPEQRKNTIRFHFMENPDPLEWNATLRGLKPESTLLCCVTKSGTTFETLALFLIALEWLTPARWKSQVIAITDPKKGDLRAFAEQEGLTTLTIHPAMGGRFSIFSPVGLFAASLAGLDAQAFVQGAQQVRDHLETVAPERNPVFTLATQLYRQIGKRPIHVMMPYTSRLKTFGEWFVQLWAESLGKDGKGFTPLAALGAVDQHSLLQLLRDGPDDKITWFVTVDRVSDPVNVPRAPVSKTNSPLTAFSLMESQNLHNLLRVEFEAVSKVLTKRERPHFKIQIEELNERNLGAFCFLLCSLTASTGALMEVDPFDQPGVEEGKIYIRESLLANKTR